ncbi:hydrolase [Pseudoalteromonas aliena]|uniref:Hydrolase n=1 Tax=Pseudoalteromonas aliena TaxID=247523 RepID=A0A1Q2GUZ4_9GAMM|nr:isochorismatase family protein [Pseudoalteromonas aliena]AQP98948.1 hydrolase [Pseudoalteromonas aliena]
MSTIFNVDATRSLFLVIDLQARLAPVIDNFSGVLNCALQLSHASQIHNVPTLITEQYKKGLGETHQQIQNALPKAEYINKTFFSACEEPHFLEILQSYARSEIIVIGTEAHVCVLQTCLDLLQNGFNVIIAADAVGSRNKEHVRIALDQLRQAGAIISCAETIIFQWTKNAATPTFKEILPIVK